MLTARLLATFKSRPRPQFKPGQALVNQNKVHNNNVKIFFAVCCRQIFYIMYLLNYLTILAEHY